MWLRWNEVTNAAGKSIRCGLRHDNRLVTALDYSCSVVGAGTKVSSRPTTKGLVHFQKKKAWSTSKKVMIRKKPSVLPGLRTATNHPRSKVLCNSFI
jgi:hypothetical protein